MMKLPFTSTTITTSCCFIILCACASVTSSFPNIAEWPDERFQERFQRNNCSKCKTSLERNVQDVLPRLTLIRQKILNIVGRNPTPLRDFSSVPESRNAPVNPVHTNDVVIPERTEYRMKEIVSFPESDVPGEKAGETVFKFHLHSNARGDKEEAMGASLLLFVDRRRKIRKGGRGKKILLEISKLTDDNKWETLTYLQTCVKKRRWKRVSLPVKSVQELLESESRNIDLKVRCKGCGRLVNIVINKNTNKKLTKARRHRKKHSKRSEKRASMVTKEKRQKKRVKQKESKGETPFLIISTRVQV